MAYPKPAQNLGKSTPMPSKGSGKDLKQKGSPKPTSTAKKVMLGYQKPRPKGLVIDPIVGLVSKGKSHPKKQK